MPTLHLVLNILLPLLFAASAWSISRRSASWSVVTAVVLCALLAIRPLLLHTPTLEHRLFPWVDYLYYYGWHHFLFPAFVLAIAAHPGARRHLRHLAAIAVALLVYHGAEVVWTLQGQDLEFHEKRSAEGDCLQTKEYTCAAASGVNLLERYDIATSEAEMARLALVKAGRGVHDLGVMRALRLKTEGSGWRPVLRETSYDELVELDRPALVPLHQSFLVNHMVCVLEADEDVVWIIDPHKGREHVTRAGFERCYLGRATYLVDDPDAERGALSRGASPASLASRAPR